MEFCLKRLSILTIFLKLTQIHSLNVNSTPQCQVLALDHQFPGEYIPKPLRFMIFYAYTELNRDFFENFYCLDGSSSPPNITFCNKNEESQKWYQYQGSIINVHSGLSLVVEERELQLMFDFWNFSFLPWECGAKNSEGLVSVFVVGDNKTLYIDVNRSINQTKLQQTPAIRWALGNDLGKRTNLDQLCRKRNPFCGAPVSGLNSCLLSEKIDYSSHFYLPKSLIKKALNTGTKICYSGGDFILKICNIGHASLVNQKIAYSASVCLGDGLWSNPNPLNCVRKDCGNHPIYPNTKVISSMLSEHHFQYADVVFYDCVRHYIGKPSRLACDRNGNWTGDPPKCRHVCHFNLTNHSGVILSPNYPNPYPIHSNCKWNITVERGFRIVLFFRDFFIEHGSYIIKTCKYDAFSIIDPPSEPENYCGSRYPERWSSRGNVVILTFVSDEDTNGKGFKIDYIAYDARISLEPMELSRNKTFPEEQNRTYVLKREEYLSYTVEIIYVVLIFALIGVITVVVAAQIIHSCNRKIHPVQPQHYPDPFKKRIIVRRNAIAQCDGSITACIKGNSPAASTFLRSMDSEAEDIFTIQNSCTKSKPLSLPEIYYGPTIKSRLGSMSAPTRMEQSKVYSTDLLSEAMAELSKTMRNSKTSQKTPVFTVVEDVESGIKTILSSNGESEITRSSQNNDLSL